MRHTVKSLELGKFSQYGHFVWLHWSLSLFIVVFVNHWGIYNNEIEHRKKKNLVKFFFPSNKNGLRRLPGAFQRGRCPPRELPGTSQASKIGKNRHLKPEKCSKIEKIDFWSPKSVQIVLRFFFLAFEKKKFCKKKKKKKIKFFFKKIFFFF